VKEIDHVRSSIACLGGKGKWRESPTAP
jgi:hypothetical protein